MPRHTTLAEPTCGKGVFTDIRHMLLKDEGRKLTKGWPAASTPPRATGQGQIAPRTRYPKNNQHQHNSQVTRKLQPRASHAVQVRRPCYHNTIAHHNQGPRGTAAVAALCATLRVVDDDAATSFFFLQSRSVDHLLLLPLTSLTSNHNQGITPLRTLTSRTRNFTPPSFTPTTPTTFNARFLHSHSRFSLFSLLFFPILFDHFHRHNPRRRIKTSQQ